MNLSLNINKDNKIIAVDAMGGDNAPRAVCLGAAEACKKFDDLNIILTGNSELINLELNNISSELRKRISVVHAEPAACYGDGEERRGAGLRECRQYGCDSGRRLIDSGQD